MDYNIFNCSGQELTAIAVAVAFSINEQYEIGDLQTLISFIFLVGNVLQILVVQRLRAKNILDIDLFGP